MSEMHAVGGPFTDRRQGLSRRKILHEHHHHRKVQRLLFSATHTTPHCECERQHGM